MNLLTLFFKSNDVLVLFIVVIISFLSLWCTVHMCVLLLFIYLTFFYLFLFVLLVLFFLVITLHLTHDFYLCNSLLSQLKDGDFNIVDYLDRLSVSYVQDENLDSEGLLVALEGHIEHLWEKHEEVSSVVILHHQEI